MKKYSTLRYLFILVIILCTGVASLTVTPVGDCNLDDNECSKQETEEKKFKLRLELPYIDGNKVGYEQDVQIIEGKTHKIKTLSLFPPVLEITDFLSGDECDLVIDMAKNKGMKDSPLVKDPRGIANDTTREVFDEWDTDGDGFIDVEEMIYLPGKSDLYFVEEDVHKMFDDLNINKDKDGKMNFEEFQEVKVEGISKYFDGLREVKSRLRSRNSQQTWLWHDEDELLQYEDLLEDYHDRFSKLTKLPRKIIEESEPLQVVRYPQNGHYHCHHDSEMINTDLPCCTYGAKECRLCRYLTVMVFLNDVETGGELAFPVADNSTFSWESWTKESQTKCNLAKHCSDSNLVIKPKRGKAIMFYNHLLDKKTRWLSALDPRALLGECDVSKGEKWVANAWININGDGVKKLTSWKNDVNWLSKNKTNKEIVDALGKEYLEPEEDKEKITNRYTIEANTVKSPTIDRAEGPTKPEGAEQTHSHETTEGINPKKVKQEFYPEPETIIVNSEKSSTPSTSETHPPKVEEDLTFLPKGPTFTLGATPAPLPLPLETVTPTRPTPVPVDSPPTPPQEGYRVLRSIMLLIEELDQVELEILARNLHSKLKLVCVPLLMNPMGSIR